MTIQIRDLMSLDSHISNGRFLRPEVSVALKISDLRDDRFISLVSTFRYLKVLLSHQEIGYKVLALKAKCRRRAVSPPSDISAVFFRCFRDQKDCSMTSLYADTHVFIFMIFFSLFVA